MKLLFSELVILKILFGGNIRQATTEQKNKCHTFLGFSGLGGSSTAASISLAEIQVS